MGALVITNGNVVLNASHTSISSDATVFVAGYWIWDIVSQFI